MLEAEGPVRCHRLVSNPRPSSHVAVGAIGKLKKNRGTQGEPLCTSKYMRCMQYTCDTCDPGDTGDTGEILLYRFDAAACEGALPRFPSSYYSPSLLLFRRAVSTKYLAKVSSWTQVLLLFWDSAAVQGVLFFPSTDEDLSPTGFCWVLDYSIPLLPTR